MGVLANGIDAVEAGRKGGKHSKEGVFYLKKTRRCSPKCPLFLKCAFMPLSKEKFDGRCALANSEIQVRTKIDYVKLFKGDEDELNESLKMILADMLLDTRKEGTIESKDRLLNAIIRVHNTIFGKKTKLEGKMDIDMNLEKYRDMIRRELESDGKSNL